MAHLPDHVPDTALSRLFTGDGALPQARLINLPGGDHLFDANDPPGHLYLLRTGRLAAVHRLEGEEPRFLGVIRPGEPAGEMAVIGGFPHRSTVVALRDSEVISIPTHAFFDAAEKDPAIMIELSRLMIRRARSNTEGGQAGEPSVYGVLAVNEGQEVRMFCERVADAIEVLGYRAVVVGKEALAAPTEWYSNVETNHDFVIYAAEYADTAWRKLVGRQVDRLFLLGRGSFPPPVELETFAADPLKKQNLVELILLHSMAKPRPVGTHAWLEATGVNRVHHLRENDPDDVGRIARVMTGQSVGLVLSGGGARAYAHVGAVRALREAGVPIDFIGGVSMGAIIAAGVAMRWPDSELEARIRDAFVDSSPLDDIALPLIAMTRGEKVKDRLQRHFGDTLIEDLWIPYFCLSSNLTSGSYQLHRHGLVRNALRASVSLPGVMPPVAWEGNVLVDGAVMKNFPADIMRTYNPGPIVGVDVSRGRSITAEDVRSRSVWKWIFSGEWRRGPPIVSLLMRAATVSTGRDLMASREASDVLITPALEGVEIRNWRAYEPAVSAGYEAGKAALSRLQRPVVDLRRRMTKEERREQA